MTRASVAQLALVFGLFVSLTGCGEPFEPPLPPRDDLNFPVGLAMHPNGRFLYVVNSDFNARFKSDSGGTISVVDTTTLEIQQEHSPFIPSFGGFIALNDDATKAYVTARQGNSLMALDVASGNATAERRGGALFCTDDDGEPTSNPGDCRVQRVPDDTEGTPLATDPFGIDVATIRRTNPATGDEVSIDVAGLSYLASDRVSALSFPNQSTSGASLSTGSLLAGSNQVARRPGTLEFYAAGRNTNVVGRFTPFVNVRDAGRFGDVETLIRLGSITVNSNTRSIDARGLAFDEAGDHLYVATRSPDALYVYDVVSADPKSGTGTRHRLDARVPIEDNPSNIAVHQTARGRRLVYVLSFEDQSIQVVDPESATVVDDVSLDASPYDMVIDTAPGRCRQPGDTCRGYVTLFDDSPRRNANCDPEGPLCGSVGVIDLDPESARFHQLVTKIH
jgi:DNA-binding beta-propeller fold protein YncE